MSNVSLKNISKIYEGGTIAVNNINIEIQDKEFVVLVGPSGCGKTTTLRMIAGLEDITKGDLLIDGVIVNDVLPKNRDIAMVFQNYALYPHMTVFENMAFGLKLRKIPKQEIQTRVNEAAAILGLNEYLNRKPKALSGGQRQRVALGRAIVRKPKVFLFDEPLSNLDAKLRVQMRTEISRLHHQLGTTMIYVTHDQTEAMTMGDRIVVMKDGIIQQVDTPINLYKNPVNKFVAGFIGSPAMNFLEGSIVKSNGLQFLSSGGNLKVDFSGAILTMLEKYINKKIWLGIRPEDIYDEVDSVKFNNVTQLDVKIDLVEPMGNESYLYFNIDDVQCLARVTSRESIKDGLIRKLKINNEKIHLFDFQSELKMVTPN